MSTLYTVVPKVANNLHEVEPIKLQRMEIQATHASYEATVNIFDDASLRGVNPVVVPNTISLKNLSVLTVSQAGVLADRPPNNLMAVQRAGEPRDNVMHALNLAVVTAFPFHGIRTPRFEHDFFHFFFPFL